MAKTEKIFSGDFKKISEKMDNGIMCANISVSRGESYEFTGKNVRCSFRVYERYSIWGKCRVSLSTLLIEEQNQIHLYAITAAGSRGRLFKFNPLGERFFLKKFNKIINKIIQNQDNFS